MKVAVVGSGVSGLGATWLLNEHSEHEAHLYEADSRPGGHANTITYTPPGNPDAAVDVDTGFIVLNPTTYPNFLRFLKLKNVSILPTEMTFSVSRDRGLFEWAGNNLFTVFAQPSRLLDAKMWRLIYDVLRFNACARRLIVGKMKDGEDRGIGRYLDENNYSDSFRDNYLIPMTAAVWSTPPDKCALDFPARTLIQFLNNHHLLQITGKPSWLTIKGGSRIYVNKILASLAKSHLRLSTPVKSIQTSPKSNNANSVVLTTADGQTETYDHVILACHSDQALALLRAGGGATADEERVLGRFGWNRNEAVLHSDVALMPKRRLAWACWNYLTSSTVDANGKRKANVDQVALTYWMNDLQHLSEKKFGPVLVTLNPPFEPRENLTAGRWSYSHPVLDSKAVLSQSELPLIQNTRAISFAGAWTRYGFHEDGFTSGLRCASEHIPRVTPPFALEDPDREPGGLWVGYIFDIIEAFGVRSFVGVLVSFVLRVFRVFFGVFVDLSHIDR
ncbi:FAD/NAD(P)-binding domain-containing protein [Rickenella mellea]|uniref:FAD/NAD(P)-binding domain-containing protein n=1 Tax=Rickenella mellea TaxID=50990 RepID=A0A4Y7Q4W8_9AGAM|nr:FAD/NAD(P)-binding domain-containing protein [Rickenella mellea]